ncbi:MAG: type II toxin-antitoxin system Phd/YefM family antitoxin [Acidobacteria bacterium]|nr:type II toxin-antitoxin system Phd/YefM family antitoxin [Acidobacteriota bacterium]
MSQSIGIRQLKAELSQCLRRVEAGEQIIITDRGAPIARLVPAGSAGAPLWVDGVIAAGQAVWSGGKPAGLTARVAGKSDMSRDATTKERR